MHVHDLDSFPNHDGSPQRKGGSQCWQNILIRHGDEGTVIDFERPCHVADALAIVVGICQHNHLVPQSDQVLTETPNVHLYAAEAGIEKVADHGNAVFAGRTFIVLLLPCLLSCGCHGAESCERSGVWVVALLSSRLKIESI